jgi:deoxyadenosine/deoxycytidine kinase
MPGLVIVEGIMGSGKSTTARHLAARLDRPGRRAEAVTERTDPHPVRATDDLDHSFQPWLDVTVDGLAERSLSKWRRFVATAQSTGRAYVLDGQLFHGDLTHLFLMEAESAAIAQYCKGVEEIARPLAPFLVYFYQTDVARAIRRIAAERGDEWVEYQVNWKLQAPYCRRRGLEGLDGLIALYKDYRALTDELFARVSIAKLAIDNSRQDWEAYYAQIERELPGVG